MADFGQLAPFIGGLLRWKTDDTTFDEYPLADNAQSIGTQTNRALVNKYQPEGLVFSTTAAAADVTNTVTETTIVGTKVGPAYPSAPTAGSIPAGALNVVGKSLKFRSIGTIASAGTVNLTIKAYAGANALLNSGANNIVAITGTLPYIFEGWLTTLTTGASGTVIGQGRFTYYSTAPVVVQWGVYNSAVVTFDLTAAYALDIKVTWGATGAGNHFVGQLTQAWISS